MRFITSFTLVLTRLHEYNIVFTLSKLTLSLHRNCN